MYGPILDQQVCSIIDTILISVKENPAADHIPTAHTFTISRPEVIIGIGFSIVTRCSRYSRTASEPQTIRDRQCRISYAKTEFIECVIYCIGIPIIASPCPWDRPPAGHT